MNRIVKRWGTIVLAGSLLLSFTGCGGRNGNHADISDEIYHYDMTAYRDSEDMPDWTGEKLKLVKWTDASSPNSTASKTTVIKNNPILDEVERITGVSYDTDNCFDNAGNSYDATIAKIIATKTFPDIGEGIPSVHQLINEDLLWDISEYIKEYAPTVYRLFGPDSKTAYGDMWKNQIEKYGGIYELAFGRGGLRDMVELDGAYDLTEEQINSVDGNGYSLYPCFYMRDDILKQLYPEAHTVEELENIYRERGAFTEEEILDVPIDSPEDFVALLYKIRDLHLMDGNAQVYPMFTHTGSDNWPVLVQLGAMFGYSTTPSSANVNYFSYYDKKDNMVKATFKQPWFKDILKLYNQLIRDGVASDEALIDTNTLFREKLLNGRYVITYGNGSATIPQKGELNGDFAYRRVYGRYQVNTDDYLFTDADYTSWNRLTFFKPSLDERELIQVLRMLEFLATNAGQKLMYWGTKSQGLYTEDEAGVLQYKDTTVRDQMLNPSKGADSINQYGLGDYWPLPIKIRAASCYDPRLFYTKSENYETKFDAALIARHTLVKSNAPCIYSSDAIERFDVANKFWEARQGFEDALLKTFAAASDEEFEKLYRNVVEYAERYGLTDEFFNEYTTYYKEELNADYMKNIYNSES